MNEIKNRSTTMLKRWLDSNAFTFICVLAILGTCLYSYYFKAPLDDQHWGKAVIISGVIMAVYLLLLEILINRVINPFIRLLVILYRYFKG